MEYWLTWVIVAAIGLVVGFIIHALMRNAQGPSLLVTLLLGIIGALTAAFFVEPYVGLANASRMAERFIWAVIGAIILSILAELLFVGTRRGHVVTS